MILELFNIGSRVTIWEKRTIHTNINSTSITQFNIKVPAKKIFLLKYFYKAWWEIPLKEKHQNKTSRHKNVKLILNGKRKNKHAIQRLVFSLIKDILNFTRNVCIKSQIEIWIKDINKIFTNEEIEIVNSHTQMFNITNSQRKHKLKPKGLPFLFTVLLFISKNK